MNKLLLPLTIILIIIITAAAGLFFILVLYPDLIILEELPKPVILLNPIINSEVTVESFDKIDPAKFKFDDLPAYNVSVKELSSLFEKKELSIIPIVQIAKVQIAEVQRTQEKPEPVYDTTRLQYLGYAVSEDANVFLFKDKLFNNIFRISAEHPSGGYELMSRDDSSFILQKGEIFFQVRK